MMVLVEEGYGENAGEWAKKADRQWKQKATDIRKVKVMIVRKKETRVKPLRFQDRI